MSVAVLSAIRTVITGVTALDRVYSQSHNDANRLPADIEGVAVLVVRGPITRYLLDNNRQRKDYLVRVLVLAGGLDYGEKAYAILPLANSICEAFAGHVTLGGLVTRVVFQGSEGLSLIEWAGAEYLGEAITLDVTEESNITVGAG